MCVIFDFTLPYTSQASRLSGGFDASRKHGVERRKRDKPKENPPPRQDSPPERFAAERPEKKSMLKIIQKPQKRPPVDATTVVGRPHNHVRDAHNNKLITITKNRQTIYWYFYSIRPAWIKSKCIKYKTDWNFSTLKIVASLNFSGTFFFSIFFFRVNRYVNYIVEWISCRSNKLVAPERVYEESATIDVKRNLASS